MIVPKCIRQIAEFAYQQRDCSHTNRLTESVTQFLVSEMLGAIALNVVSHSLCSLSACSHHTVLLCNHVYWLYIAVYTTHTHTLTHTQFVEVCVSLYIFRSFLLSTKNMCQKLFCLFLMKKWSAIHQGATTSRLNYRLFCTKGLIYIHR